MLCQVGMARLAEFFLRITILLAISWNPSNFMVKITSKNFVFQPKKTPQKQNCQSLCSHVLGVFRISDPKNPCQNPSSKKTRPDSIQCEPSIGWWCSWHHVWDTWRSWNRSWNHPWNSPTRFSVRRLEFESELRKRSDPKFHLEVPKQK